MLPDPAVDFRLLDFRLLDFRLLDFRLLDFRLLDLGFAARPFDCLASSSSAAFSRSPAPGISSKAWTEARTLPLWDGLSGSKAAKTSWTAVISLLCFFGLFFCLAN